MFTRNTVSIGAVMLVVLYGLGSLIMVMPFGKFLQSEEFVKPEIARMVFSWGEYTAIFLSGIVVVAVVAAAKVLLSPNRG